MSKSFLERLKELGAGPQPIKIGVLTTKTGPLDYYGTMQVRGLDLGIRYATSGSQQVAGRPIELIVEDDASDPTTAGRKARELIEQQGAHILQGCVSSAATIVVASVAQEYQRVLLVEPAAADSITGENWNRYVFRTAASVWQDAAAGGRYAVEHLGKTFCYLAPDYIFGRQSSAAWRQIIEGYGGRSLADVLVPPDTADFRPFLRQILDTNAEVLVQSWSGAGHRPLFSQMRELGVFERMKVTGGLGDREARHALGMDAVGIVGICKYSYILPTNEVNDWLTAKHIERYGEPPDLFTGGGFAAGIALVEALEQTGGNPDADALIRAMEGLSFEGPKGTYTFRRQDHQALQPMYVVEMVPDPERPWAIPKLIREAAPEETAPPMKEAVTVTKDFIIETERLRREFGALVAVANVSIQVRPNTIHSIIGPNGAGKTTFFNLLSGTLEPTSGRVYYKGRDITNLPLHRTAHLGIGRSFQITNIFPNLTVIENVMVPLVLHHGKGFRCLRALSGEKKLKRKAEAVLDKVGLLDAANRQASELPYGDKRLVEMAIVLARNPKLVMLDEPTAGMNPEETERMIHLIKDLAGRFGTTFFLTEHDMKVVFAVASQILVLHQGVLLATGDAAAIRADPRVREAYLGGSTHD
jgi:branched-chain amino acid transport system substrate-binding protein